MTEANQPGPKPGTEGESSFHATYTLDLANPSAEDLERIKNTVVRRVQESIQHEIDSLGGDQAPMKTTYDKHSSMHDSG